MSSQSAAVRALVGWTRVAIRSSDIARVCHGGAESKNDVQLNRPISRRKTGAQPCFQRARVAVMRDSLSRGTEKDVQGFGLAQAGWNRRPHLYIVAPMPLPQFHPAVQAWFARAFPQGATPAQIEAWPAIAA